MFLAIAVVRLVVDGENVFHPHQVGHHPLNHLAFGFLSIQFLTDAPLQQLSSALR